MAEWEPAPTRELYARRVAALNRPRVQFCWFTRKWVVCYDGRRHKCGRSSYKRDEAFGAWDRAMAAANAVRRADHQRVFDSLCATMGGDWWWQS